jgi:hypothetical protein
MRLLPALVALLLFATQAPAADLIHFWDTPQHGGNSFNRLPPDQAYFDALESLWRDLGAAVLRQVETGEARLSDRRC